MPGPNHNASITQNHKAHLANAYNELGKELSSTKIRVIGNYTLGKVIGEGAYGKVRLGTHRLTSTRVAVKQIPKAMSSSLTREIHHHRQLHHPHVTQMYEVIATESSIWIVTELCCGGELFDYLVEKGRLNESEARIIFGQLCLAVAYLHDKGIVHRDLKLENVLLDERCRVKLGDFGFTREFDRGLLMETFCGTTGYAAPEMLLGQKYLGPEVDIWSLGVILYCLLTGTLPFDDDDETAMRNKVIQGEFQDPEWLSIEARNLIKDILLKNPSDRLTIPQILSHPWYTTRTLSYQQDSRTDLSISVPGSLHHSVTDSAASEHTFHSASSELDTSSPTTPDDLSTNDPFEYGQTDSDGHVIHRNPSEITLRKLAEDLDDVFLSRPKARQPETVLEEGEEEVSSWRPSPPPLASSSSASKAPPTHTLRTPARTKRRSVSSTLSEPDSPTEEQIPTPLPQPSANDIDFSTLLDTPAPIIFSTPQERELLNSLSNLGFDTGQMVHSVLSNACDAAGATWWMLLKKAEKKPTECREVNGSKALTKTNADGSSSKKGKKHRANVGVQTELVTMSSLALTRSAPQLAFVPPTPTVPHTRTASPPIPTTPTRSTMLSPSPSTITGESSRSHPSTPSGSLKDKDSGSKGRKTRAGSVSIMQRATTALEAAGLVRKRSSEAVKDEKEREKSRDPEPRTAVPEEKRSGSKEEARSAHGHSLSSAAKLTKSPPHTKANKDQRPSTPEMQQPRPQIGSPWVLAGNSPPPSDHHAHAPTPVNSPGGADAVSPTSIPSFDNGSGSGKGGQRNRASILTAFRLWFNEEARRSKKGKRKESDASLGIGSPPSPANAYRPFASVANNPPAFGTAKRRRSGSSNTGYPSRGRHRTQRASISSRRSSSVNSRRSSASAKIYERESPQIHLDSPHNLLDSPLFPSRYGTHTPNSEAERGDYSSRPSSGHSFSVPMKRHRKSPSVSSTGSGTFHHRATSPMQRHHRRAGSGSSNTTRVVRQTQSGSSNGNGKRPVHVRSNSTASSVPSPGSSRPASFYDAGSDIEYQVQMHLPRSASPSKSHGTPRRAGYGSTSGATTFVAHKRQGPFMSPIASYASLGGGSIGRSSWKKSWGVEPPGWQTRTTTAHLPVEVLAVSADSGGYRDVISGRHSLNLGDESDWVDEDDLDDFPAFAGGLGQMSASVSLSDSIVTGGRLGISLAHAASHQSAFAQHVATKETVLTLAPAPRGHRSAGPPKRMNIQTSGKRQKSGHSPVERVSPVPVENAYELPESRGGRRQLPSGRSGPAFRAHAIQEEDEDEE